jgi:folate-binding protein YgfZ
MNAPLHRLDHLGLLRFSGPDSAGFLQGQLSNDLRRVTAGSPLLAAYSTPQGRVLAVLQLLPTASGIVAVLPRELVAGIAARLRKFQMRSKLQIEDVSGEFELFGAGDAGAVAAAGLEAPDAQRPYLERDGVGIARVCADPSRHWVLAPAGTLRAAGILRAADDDAAQAGWRLADVRAGIAQVYAATSELFVAQMLNLDLVDGISFSKGCYTGQEIIARTQHLGRIKRRMFRLALPAGGYEVGAALRLGDGRSGRVVEIAPAAGGQEALAVFPLDAGADVESEPGAGAAVAATLLPLPYPLTATA